jgi:predicted transcriptional regulator
MPTHKVQSLRSLRDEMVAVAKGERRAPVDAGRASFNSVETLIRLLTPDNRQLLSIIKKRNPESVAELASVTGRSQPNLSRTLAKLEAAGLVAMESRGRKKRPVVTAREIRIRIDPTANRDRLEVAR